MPSAESEHLFVYGTLMSRYDNAPAVALRYAATRLGPATFRGRMHLVNARRAFSYPAVIESADPADVVHGELYRLDDRAILRRLDEYEGPEYQRVTRGVTLEGGATHNALVYLYIAPIDGLPRIADGRFGPAG